MMNFEPSACRSASLEAASLKQEHLARRRLDVGSFRLFGGGPAPPTGDWEDCWLLGALLLCGRVREGDAFVLAFIAGGSLFCLRVAEEGFISLRMIQRDYLMRMIQEFIKMMVMVLESKKAGDWGAVEENLDRAAKTYLGLDRGAVCRLEAVMLKQRLIGTGPTHEYKVRAQVLCRILVESAAAAAGRGEGERERALLLKTLHLLLDTGRWICFDEGNFSLHISSCLCANCSSSSFR